MSGIERTIQSKYGPRFFRDGERDMFENRIDSRACVGPREATKTDKQNHSALWAAYLAEMTAEEDRKLKRKGK